MHSTLNRAQGVFGFFTTVALFVAGLAALSVFLYPTDDVTSSVKLRDVKVYVFPSILFTPSFQSNQFPRYLYTTPITSTSTPHNIANPTQLKPTEQKVVPTITAHERKNTPP